MAHRTEIAVDDGEVAPTPSAMMQALDPDRADLEEMIRGNAGAFARIYNRYRDRVYGFAYRMIRADAAAEDVTHEVFLALIVDPQRYVSERGSLLSYLCGIARHHVLRYFRRGKYEAEPAFDDLEPDPAADALDVILERERAEQVNASIDSLPPLQREVLILREFHDLSYSEIAHITDTDINAVKARLHRARHTLAGRLSYRVPNGGSSS